MTLFRKKNKDEWFDNDLEITTEMKEPFSWDVFWDEQIIGRWKTFKS